MNKTRGMSITGCNSNEDILAIEVATFSSSSEISFFNLASSVTCRDEFWKISSEGKGGREANRPERRTGEAWRAD